MTPTPLLHKRILLVDDHFTTRELMSMILGGVGYRVSTAANGKEAMEHLRTHERPDLILLDLRMPVMDGWELREVLKNDQALASIPVVVLSGADERGEDVPNLQGTPFLRKPVQTEELLLVVKQCCGGCGGAAVK
jgi:CheY-like chemotaxis protein